MTISPISNNPNLIDDPNDPNSPNYVGDALAVRRDPDSEGDENSIANANPNSQAVNDPDDFKKIHRRRVPGIKI